MESRHWAGGSETVKTCDVKRAEMGAKCYRLEKKVDGRLMSHEQDESEKVAR